MKNLSVSKIVALLLVCLCAICLPSQAAAFSEVIVIGDSLSDAGNFYTNTVGIYPPSPPYWEGRFSNGPTWVEVLAGRLGVATPTASWGILSNRTNYAVGGAKTDYTSPGIGWLDEFGMDKQVEWFHTDLTNNPSWNVSEALFVVWGGANDYMNYLDSGGSLPTPATNLRQRIETLIGLGAQNFLTCNLPSLGDTPKYRGTAKQTQADQLSQQFATNWLQQVSELSVTNPACTFYYFDVYSAFENILANPGAYGLSNVTDKAYDGTSVVSNPDEYLFWDQVHPTRAGHALLGNQAYTEVIPEPTSVLLLLLTLPVLLICCRKS